MTGIITSTSEIKKVLKNIKNKLSYDEQNLVAEVSTKNAYTNVYKEIKLKSYKKIVIIDFGVKHNILRLLKKRSCNLTIFPYDTNSKEILSSRSRWDCFISRTRRSKQFTKYFKRYEKKLSIQVFQYWEYVWDIK